MIGPQAFAIAHLAIILLVLAWAGLTVRRCRTEPFRGRRGVRYRRLTDADVLRRLDAADKKRRI